MPMQFYGNGTVVGLAVGGLPDKTVTKADLADNVLGSSSLVYVTRSAAQGIAQGAEVKVLFDYKAADPGGHFDTATNRLIPKTAGDWLVVVGLGYINGGPAGTVQSAIVKKNGSTSVYGVQAALARSTVSAIYAMNGTTDYVESFAYSTSANDSIQSGGVGTYLFAYLLRAA